MTGASLLCEVVVVQLHLIRFASYYVVLFMFTVGSKISFSSEWKKSSTAELTEDLQREKKALATRLKHMLRQSLPSSRIHIKVRFSK